MSLGRDLVERTCRYATWIADGLHEAGYEVLNELDVNQVRVAVGSDGRTRGVIEVGQRRGTRWCGGVVLHSRTAARRNVVNWASSYANVEASRSATMRGRSTSAQLKVQAVLPSCS